MATVVERGRAPAGTRPLRGAAGWLLFCALVAGVVAIDPWGFAPFGPVRLTAITVALLASGAALGGRSILLDRRTAACWAALLAWLLLATVRAADPLHAWLGTPDRRFGWLAWVLLAVAWTCGAAASEERDLRRLLRGATLASALLGAYAVAELAGVAPAAGTFAGGRLGGPYGQPAFLGAAGVLLAPVAAGLALDARERTGWRVLAASAAALGTVAILGSQTRAAWVGLAVACVAIAPRLWRQARRHPVAALGGAALLGAVLVVTPVGARALSIADVDGTASARGDEWRVAVAALTASPLLGHGPEGYRSAFPAAVDAAYAREHGRDVITDRAHNGVLDVAVTGGAPAGALYLGLLVLVALPCWRVARRRDPLLAGAAVGVLAYAFQQQLLFPALEVDPLFWVLAGTVGAAAHATGAFGHAAAAATGTVRPLRVPVPLAGGLAVAAAVVLLAGGLEVAADRSLERASTLGTVHPAAALAEADRAVSLRPDSIRAHFVAGRIATRGGTLTDVDAALDRMEAGLARSPRDPALRTEHARLLHERALRSGLAADLDRARAALEQLVLDDPAHPAHRMRLGALLAVAGDLAGADTQLATAERLDPRAAAPAVERARIALLRDDLATAVAAAGRARTVDPAHPRLPSLLDEIDAR